MISLHTELSLQKGDKMLSEKTFVKHGVIEEKDINYNQVLRVLDIIETENETNPTLAKKIENELKKSIYIKNPMKIS